MPIAGPAAVAAVTDASQAAAWGARFQAITADAGQASVRALRRYQELLDRVARGEITPEEVQRQFSAYLQAHTATSARELVELSVGLLAGLLHVEATYRETLLAGLLPGSSPVPAPPSPASLDLVNWFQALSTYAAEQSARAMSRHQMLIDRVASGEIPAAQVQEHGRRFLELHSPAFLGEVMNLGLSFVEGLQRSSARVTEGLYEQVLGPDRATAGPEPPIVVELRAPSGETASATIVVENTRTVAADVACRVSEFAARAFGRRFTAPLRMEPSRFTLAPGEQRDVSLQLPLDPGLFAPDADYIATLQIAGAGEQDLIVHLMARASSRRRDRKASGKK